jgi:3-phosphoshikimate 1-carboxyvinyltransferase
MIDEFPVFAIAAAFASGTSIVTQAEELRYKESDRISALCNELIVLGADVSETPDGFVITGGNPLTGGNVDPHGDHRLAMSLAVAGLGANKAISVNDSRIINESFPEFIPILQSLGANLEVG